MQGDFSSWRFDRRDNDQAVLFQQGRVILDADLTAAERIALEWRGQTARDVIGRGVAAAPAADAAGFAVLAAARDGEAVRLALRPGRIWADGLHVHLPGDPATPVERLAPYYTPPLAAAAASAAGIADGTRDAVILEVALEALNAFQEPERLLEPALGGPDTAERAVASLAFRMLRLGPGEDCRSILGRLADGPAGKGRLSVSLEPTTLVPGDCPVVEGGGYAGFEHNLYRIEVAETTAGTPAFKWSQCNGGLVGRGRFHANPTPHVELLANRPAILHSGLSDFYLEALAPDPDLGHWRVVYGTQATLNADGELDLADPPTFGALPGGPDTVFFRLWNGLLPVAGFLNEADPQPLHDGIRLVFDAPAPGVLYRPGDRWTFQVRAGEVDNPEVLLDRAPPEGPLLRRVPLAEIAWTAAADTAAGGRIEDCRRRFRPLVDQRTCCTLLVGDGITSFGDFDRLEEAAQHLPEAGGELCLLPGLHFANLDLAGRRGIHIHGCRERTFVLPRPETPERPILRFAGCTGIRVSALDLFAPFGTAVVMEGEARQPAREHVLADCRILARLYGLRADAVEELTVARNQIWIMDLAEGRAALSVRARHGLIERNRLAVWPFETRPEDPDRPDDGGGGEDPADPCREPGEFYLRLAAILPFVQAVWAARVLPKPRQPYRAQGGIHLRGACQRVRVLENRVEGGAGHGIALGGLLPGETAGGGSPDGQRVLVAVRGGLLHGFAHDRDGNALAQVGVHVRRDGAAVTALTTDGQGYFAARAADGSYELAVDAGWRVVEVREGTLRDAPFFVLVLEREKVSPALDRAFLYAIAIQGNEIERMGLSGVGFLPHDGRVAAPELGSPTTLEDYLALLPVLLAPRELVGRTNLVRDLTIRANRLHGNLQAVFDDTLRAFVRTAGLGGISLAMVEQGLIEGNSIQANGTSASNPTCGIFVGYAEDVAVTGNQIAGNGPLDAGYDGAAIEGWRGGIVVRLATALLAGGAEDGAQKPALRVADNRVDQPAGRALTAMAFGPVSCVGNLFNAEREGRLANLDQIVGSVLIANLGGIHRQLQFAEPPRFTNDTLTTTADPFQNLATAEALLPGGDTLFNSNQVRCGPANRAIVSQLLLTLDDLGVDGNQAAAFRPDLLFGNLVCLAASLRVTDNRLRERTRTCYVSALSWAVGLTAAGRLAAMNTTAHNQGDHCIVALSNAPAGGLPVVEQGNLEIARDFCRRIAESPQTAQQFVVQGLAQALARQAAEGPRLQQASAVALQQGLRGVAGMQAALQTTRAAESARLAGSPADAAGIATVPAERAARIVAELGRQADLAAIREAAAPDGGFVVDGRLVDERGAGRAGLTVELLGRNGRSLNLAATTDAAGYYAVTVDAEQAEAVRRQGTVTARVLDAQGSVLKRLDEPLAVAEGTPERRAATIERERPTRAATLEGRVIFVGERGAGTASTPLENVRGIGPKTAARLRAEGIADVEALLRTPVSRLVGIAGFDADVVRREARAALDRTAAERGAPPPRDGERG